MIFDLRKFWLGIAAYGVIIGAVIAAVGAGFYAFVGLPAKGFQQAVTQPATTQGSGSKAVPVEIERKVAAPSSPPLSPSVQPVPATNVPAANMTAARTPPRTAAPVPDIVMPELKIIVPEPGSARRGRQSRSGY